MEDFFGNFALYNIHHIQDVIDRYIIKDKIE